MLFRIFIQLAGGLGLFLHGIRLLSESLEKAAGSRFRSFLNRLTTNRVKSVLAGFCITSLLQSSSATTVMVIGLVRAGLLDLSQSLFIMMGAGVGTTVTAWILSFELGEIAPLFILAGLLISSIGKRSAVVHTGAAVTGFGVLFTGLGFMTQATVPLTETEFFYEYCFSYNTPLIALLSGILVTVLLQSSSACIGMLIGLASGGAVSLEFCLYMVMGANIGTCITGILAAAGAGLVPMRAAVVYLFFNVFGTVIFSVLFIFFPLAELLVVLLPRIHVQIAIFHTFFNLITMLIFLLNPKILLRTGTFFVREKALRG